MSRTLFFLALFLEGEPPGEPSGENGSAGLSRRSFNEGGSLAIKICFGQL